MVGRQLPDERLAEGVGGPGRADEDRRPERSGDRRRIGQLGRREAPGGDRRGVDGERELVGVEIGPPDMDEPVTVGHDDRPPDGRLVDAVTPQVLAQQLGDPERGRARAEEQEPVATQPVVRPARGQETGQDHGGRSLDVVVEARQAVAEAGQDPEGVVLLEVLPLDDRVREGHADTLDERLQDVVIGLAAEPGGPIAEVERIGQEVLAVGTDVQRDGERAGRVDAGGGAVQRKLADRDRHPTHALVAEAQDPLVVGHHDQAHVLGRPGQDRRDPTGVGGRDPDAPRPAEDVAELLAGPPDGRGVDDRQELLEVLDEEPVEQGLVAVMEGGQADVLLQVVGLAPDVLELERDLLLDRRDVGRQQAAQPEGRTLTLGNAVSLFRSGWDRRSAPRRPTRRRPRGASSAGVGPAVRPDDAASGAAGLGARPLGANAGSRIGLLLGPGPNRRVDRSGRRRNRPSGRAARAQWPRRQRRRACRRRSFVVALRPALARHSALAPSTEPRLPLARR